MFPCCADLHQQVKRKPTPFDDAVNQQLEAAHKGIEDVLHRGQEDIYNNEALIRESEDHLAVAVDQ